jgi:hypothetical protein
MSPHRTPARLLSVAAVGIALTVGCLAAPASAVERSPKPGTPDVQLDHLDRGLVAAKTSEGVFLSWRLLGHEASGSSATGLTGTDFNVYRDGEKLATVTNSTNFQDTGGTAASGYQVRAVVAGVEVDSSATATPWGGNFVDIPLKKPADGTTPAGQAYT